MPKLVKPDCFKLFESNLVEQHILSDSFKELSAGQVLPYNRKRWLNIGFLILMALRMMVSTIMSSSYIDSELGETFWSLGIAGYLCKCCGIVMGSLAAAYLITFTYCENKLKLGFLYDLHPDSQQMFASSDYSVLLKSKRFNLMRRSSVIFKYLMPYCNVAPVYALAVFQAYELKPTVMQLVNNVLWAVMMTIWAVNYSTGVIMYLISRKVNSDVKTLRMELNECSHTALLIRVLGLQSAAAIRITKYNEFVKFILGQSAEYSCC